MELRDMYSSYLDSMSGAREDETPPPEGEEEEDQESEIL